MAKRVYKLQELVAHASNVNCLSIAKKTCRLFITGGDDHKVVLWAIGKPTSLMNLCGHTSSVDSLAFDPAEVLVLAGASAGAIKLWDLEEAKLVRSLTGHRLNCSAVEFHPFGEFFASGSIDTNLKIWDIRKKGCIHTYKGHTGGISNIRFTPDGRWIVTGGLDNVVKVWDLTAGKHLHDFKFHDGPIRTIDFHPLEFLLATGSADRTVKFWDLESFELIGSTRPEVNGVRAIAFNPDGKTLFCGLDDSLKVYSWEPVICHDTVDVGWSTLADLCIHEEKLLACSHYRNSVAVWVADMSLIKPYGCSLPEGTDYGNKVDNPFSSPKINSDGISLSSSDPCSDMKDDIKNIYIDCSSETTVMTKPSVSISPPRLDSSLDKVHGNDSLKESYIKIDDWKPSDQAHTTSFIAPTSGSQDPSPHKAPSKSFRETIAFSKTKPGMLLRPANVRKSPISKNEIDKHAPVNEPVPFEAEKFSSVSEPVGGNTEISRVLNMRSHNFSVRTAENPSKSLQCPVKDVANSSEMSLQNSNDSVHTSKGSDSYKIVNGVAVVTGRTRTLVEKFERQEKLVSEDQSHIIPSVSEDTPDISGEASSSSTSFSERTEIQRNQEEEYPPQRETPEIETGIPSVGEVVDTEVISVVADVPCSEDAIKPAAVSLGRNSVDEPIIDSSAFPETNRTTVLIPDSSPQLDIPTSSKVIPTNPSSTKSSTSPFSASRHKSSISSRTPHSSKLASRRSLPTPSSTASSRSSIRTIRTANRARGYSYTCPPTAPNFTSQNDQLSLITNMNPSVVSDLVTESPITSSTDDRIDNDPLNILMEGPSNHNRDTISAESLMQSHDEFLSSLKSRLTKLQMVRHFWERHDMKGAVDALKRLPDYSVQADFISVLIDKMEVLNLDFCSIILPVLVGLLASKIDRHASLALEFLLKLVAIFGPVIRSTTSAPPSIGVDLHADQRRESCNRCHLQLQKVQEILPTLSRRSGQFAKSALELNLVLQET